MITISMTETLTHWQALQRWLSRGPEFSVHSPRTHSLQSSATTGSKPHVTLLWPLQAADTHVLHIHICTENTHTHKIMISKRKTEKERKLRCGGANLWPQAMGSHGRWIYTGTSRTAGLYRGILSHYNPQQKDEIRIHIQVTFATHHPDSPHEYPKWKKS